MYALVKTMLLLHQKRIQVWNLWYAFMHLKLKWGPGRNSSEKGFTRGGFICTGRGFSCAGRGFWIRKTLKQVNKILVTATHPRATFVQNIQISWNIKLGPLNAPLGPLNAPFWLHAKGNGVCAKNYDARTHQRKRCSLVLYVLHSMEFEFKNLFLGQPRECAVKRLCTGTQM